MAQGKGLGAQGQGLGGETNEGRDSVASRRQARRTNMVEPSTPPGLGPGDDITSGSGGNKNVVGGIGGVGGVGVLDSYWDPSHDSWDVFTGLSSGRSLRRTPTSTTPGNNNGNGNPGSGGNSQSWSAWQLDHGEGEDVSEDYYDHIFAPQSENVGRAVFCHITTTNVRRLQFAFSPSSFLPHSLLQHNGKKRVVLHLYLDNTRVPLPYNFTRSGLNKMSGTVNHISKEQQASTTATTATTTTTTAVGSSNGRPLFLDFCWHRESTHDEASSSPSSSSTSSSSASSDSTRDKTTSGISSVPHACDAPMQPLKEKVPLTAGPIRHVYARPFYIVYGTPQVLTLLCTHTLTHTDTTLLTPPPKKPTIPSKTT